MKRRAAAVLALGLAVSMTACGGEQTSSVSSSVNTETTAEAVSASSSSAAAASTVTDAAQEGETVSAEDTLAGIKNSAVISRLAKNTNEDAAKGTTESAAALGTEITAAIKTDKMAAANIPENVISEAGSTGDTAASAEENVKNGKHYIGNSMIGTYTQNGYTNSWYNLKISLPSSYELVSRSTVSLNGESVVDSSNDSDTYTYIRSLLEAGGDANVFSATNGTTYIDVYLEGLGNYDHWENERTIARNTAATYESSIRSNLSSAGYTVTDFDYEVSSGTFAGKVHYFGVYSFYVDGTPFYGIEIYILDGRNDPLMTVDIQGYDIYDIADTDPYFTKLY